MFLESKSLNPEHSRYLIYVSVQNNNVIPRGNGISDIFI